MSRPPALERLSGDAPGLIATGQLYTSLADAADRARAMLGHGAATTASSLVGPRAHRFAEASHASLLRVAALTADIGHAGEVLVRYGRALEVAQEDVDDLARRWLAAQQTIEHYQSAESPAALELVLDARDEQRRYEQQGIVVQEDFRRAAGQAADALEQVAATLAPHAAGSSPEAVLTEALGAWAAVLRNGSSLDLSAALGRGKTGFDAWSAVKDLAETPERTRLLQQALRTWQDVEAARVLAIQVEHLEVARVDAVARVAGEDSYAALRQLMASQEVIDAKNAEVVAAETTLLTSRSELQTALMATSRFAKGIAVLGVVSGTYDVFNPGHQGLRGRGDQIAGGMSAAASTAILLNTAAAGALLGPIGGPVVVGALAVAAAWTVGNLVYDHWGDITHATSVAADWVDGQLDEAGDALADGANNVAAGAEKAAEGAKDLVGKGLKKVGGLF